MNNPNNNTNEGSVRRVVTWLSDYAWLLAGCLFVLVAVRSGSDQAEDETMRAHRKRIEDMPRTDRERLQHNQTEFGQLTTADEQRLRDLHEAVSGDANLDRTLTRWHNWLATLSIEDRERLLSLDDPRERMEAVRKLRQASQGRPGGWFGRRWDETPWDRIQKFPVRFRPEDYQSMLKVAATWSGLTAEPDRDDARSRLAHHVLIVTTLLDQCFPDWDQPPGPPSNGARSFFSRLEFPADLREQLIDAVSDSNTQRVLRERAGGGRGTPRPEMVQSIMLMSNFARGLSEEVRRVVGSAPLSEDDRLAIYLKLPGELQQELDQLPREVFSARIQTIALRQSLGPEAATRLERLSKLFGRGNRRPGSGGQNPGRRPDGSDQRPPGERPPGRFGDRPPEGGRPPGPGNGPRR